MNTQTFNGLAVSIADRKKSELDALTDAVNSAQYTVDQLQSVVTSISAKANTFAGFLAEAQTNQANALTYLNTAIDVVNQAKVLNQNTETAKTQSHLAQQAMGSTSQQMAILIDKLILSVEVINKITLLVNKQKLQNPVIPSELTTILAKATTDGNNAVAKTLTALSSCYAAESTLIESQGITALAAEKAEKLVKRLTCGARTRTEPLDATHFTLTLADDATGLLALLQHSFDQSVEAYNDALNANNIVGAQLDFAQAQLGSATTRLNSLNAGLAAAQAAAFAA